MSDATEQVDCPRCGGHGIVTLSRIRDLKTAGYHVGDLGVQYPCVYCGGAGRAPRIVAELVAPNSFDHLARTVRFSSRKDCEEVIRRLDGLPKFYCRDDAWAATGELLAQSTFDPADLPRLLWDKAVPLLAGNSLGRMLAVEVRLGLFSWREALDQAFSLDHPRARNMGPLDGRGPETFAAFHAFWLRAEDAEALSAILPEKISNFPIAFKQPRILAMFLKLLAEVAPDVVARHGETWLRLIADYHGDFICDIWDSVLPRLPADRVRSWMAALNVVHACPRCGGSGQITDDTISTLQAESYAVGEWKPSPCGYCASKGAVPAFVARLAPTDGTFTRVLQRTPYSSREFVLHDLEALEADPSWPMAWAAAGTRLARADFPRADLGRRIWAGARVHLDGSALGRLLAALVGCGVLDWSEAIELAIPRDHTTGSAESPADQSGAALRFFANSELWLSSDNVWQAAEQAPMWLAGIDDANERSHTLAAFTNAIARHTPQALVAAEDRVLDFVADLPWSCKADEFLRSNAAAAIVRDTLCLLPVEDACRWIDRLLDMTDTAESPRDFFLDREVIRFAARHRSADDVLALLERCIARATSFADRAQIPTVLTWLSLAYTWRADERCFATLIEAVSHAGQEENDAWGLHDTGSNAEQLLGALAWGYGEQPWSWQIAEQIVTRACSARDIEARVRGLRGAVLGLRNSQAPWLARAQWVDQALRLLLQKCIELPKAKERAAVFQELHPLLALREKLLCDVEPVWFELLRNLSDCPEKDPDGRPLSDVAVILLSENALQHMPTRDVDHWVKRLLEASDCRTRSLGNADAALLRLTGDRFGASRFAAMVSQLLGRIQQLPDRMYWPLNIGCLAQNGVAGHPVATADTYRMLCEALLASGLDDAFSAERAARDDEARYFSPAARLVKSIGDSRATPFGWDVFRALVDFVEQARIPDNRARGLGQLGFGLADVFPTWGRQAIQLLLERAERFGEGARRGLALEGISHAVMARWRSPDFLKWFSRLVAISRSTPSAPEVALNAWIACCGTPPQPSPRYTTIFQRMFDLLLQCDEDLDTVSKVNLVGPMSSLMFAGVARQAFATLVGSLLAFIDRLPPTEEGQAAGLRAVLHATHFNSDLSMDEYLHLTSEVAQRLIRLPCGQNTYGACNSFRQDQLLSGRGVILSLEMLARMAEFPGATFQEDWQVQGGLGLFASVLAQCEEPFPGSSVEARDFDRFLTAVQSLPMVEVMRDPWLEVTLDSYKGIPRLTAQAALLRRFMQVGDEAWRDDLIDRVLDHARSYENPAHQRMLVLALLEGLGEGDLTTWHRSALQKLTAFASVEDRGNLSILQHGIVRRLTHLGELTSAAQVARAINDPDLRSESLAEVARTMSTTTPAISVEMLDEIVSAEVRSRLAADLSSFPTMTDDVERVWTLLRAAADDPGTIQTALANLLSRTDIADVRGILATLGMAGLASPAATPTSVGPAGQAGSDPLAPIIQLLVEADLITTKKRDRLIAWRDEHKQEIDDVVRRALLEYLVASNQISQDDVDELCRSKDHK